MKYFLIIASTILFSFSAQAQTRVVNGKITAYNSFPVMNVEVSSKKAKATTISDAHGNFSIVCMEKDIIMIKPKAFRPVTDEHIGVYGAYNDERLTGLHETAHVSDFSYGISDRGASIRIPIITVENGWKGWLEDRRPASNGDPYKIAGRIIQTVKSVNVEELA